MTENDVKRIFGDFIEDGIIRVKGASVSVDKFLGVAGFENAPNNPSKQDLHDIDQGVKGYAEFIEKGNYN